MYAVRKIKTFIQIGGDYYVQPLNTRAFAANMTSSFDTVKKELHKMYSLHRSRDKPFDRRQ